MAARKPSAGHSTQRERDERRRLKVIEAGGKTTSVVLTAAGIESLRRAAAAGFGQNEAINYALRSTWQPQRDER
jgi:hypothetical protein